VLGAEMKLIPQKDIEQEHVYELKSHLGCHRTQDLEDAQKTWTQAREIKNSLIHFKTCKSVAIVRPLLDIEVLSLLLPERMTLTG
jgi:hypothetical protein